MKKYFVILVVALMSVAPKNTKAQEVKNQYVKWVTVPTDPSDAEVASWLKLAMVGGTIPGAALRCEASDYKAVWGDGIYEEVLNTSISNFATGPADGNERNYAIGASGQPVPAGTLSNGTRIIRYKRANGQFVTIAKWGNNGCLNPQDPIIGGLAKDDPDPDVRRDDKSNTANKDGNTNTNTITFTPNQNSQELSWTAGYAVYSTGRNDRQTDFLVDASLFKSIQDSKECCGGNNNSGTGYVSTGMQVQGVATMPMYPASYPAGNTSQEVTIRNKPNATDWINTVFNGFNTAANVYQSIKFGQMVNCLCPHRNPCGSCNQCSGGRYYGGNGGGGYYPNPIWTPSQGGSPAGFAGYNNHAIDAGMYSSNFNYAYSNPNYSAIVSPGLSGGYNNNPSGPGFNFRRN